MSKLTLYNYGSNPNRAREHKINCVSLSAIINPNNIPAVENIQAEKITGNLEKGPTLVNRSRKIERDSCAVSVTHKQGHVQNPT